MAHGWEGRTVRLVPLDRERHFDNCLRWLNDPEVTAWTLIGDFPLTRLIETNFFEKMCRAAEGSPDLGFAIETRGEPPEHVGMCGLHAINYRHGSATAGLVIGRPPLWGKGLGTDALAALLRYAFEVAGLRLILSAAFAENLRSVRMQRRCGFLELGTIPGRYWKRGAFRDEVQFVLPRAAWATHATGTGAAHG